MKTGAVVAVVSLVAGLGNALAGDGAAPLNESDVAAFVSLWPETAKALAGVEPEFDWAVTNALGNQLQEMAAMESKDKI